MLHAAREEFSLQIKLELTISPNWKILPSIFVVLNKTRRVNMIIMNSDFYEVAMPIY